ncbi:MAG TPA: c-type cytochrome [Rhodopila sp.]|nr:c-type cytochrome [Rhodopila sp.]
MPAAADITFAHQTRCVRAARLTARSPFYAAILMLWCQPGLAQDADAGRAIAARWCVTCHVVQPGQTHATSTGAPSFAAVAARKSLTPDGLSAFLQTSHVRMPDLHLSRREISDLTAYIMSQKPAPG